MKLIALICFACLGSALGQTNEIRLEKLDLIQELQAFEKTELRTAWRSNYFRLFVATIANSEESLQAFSDKADLTLTNVINPLNERLAKTNLGPISFTNNSKLLIRNAYITRTGMMEAKYRTGEGLGGGWVRIERLPDYIQTQLAFDPTNSIGTDFQIFRMERKLKDLKLQSARYGAAANALRTLIETSEPKKMPASIAAEIRAAAEKKWPKEYDMQEWEIKKQTESWYRLNGGQP